MDLNMFAQTFPYLSAHNVAVCNKCSFPPTIPLPINYELKPSTTTTLASNPFASLTTTTTMGHPFSFVANGTLGDPFKPTKPNTTMFVAFPTALNPPNDPFQPNATIVDPFAPTLIIKLVFYSFSFGVQASNVYFITIGVSSFDLVATNVPPSGYPNIFTSNTTNGSTQWTITNWTLSLGVVDVWFTF
jgi:hypothetical protein